MEIACNTIQRHLCTNIKTGQICGGWKPIKIVTYEYKIGYQ